jgi:hypothetical protein
MSKSKEILKMKELTAKIELYLALEKFCDSVCNHEPCLNFRDCDECSLKQKREELKEEIMYAF